MSEKYTVVIPAYNAEKTISACLSSVCAQTLLPFEVLVVDDCSRDGTAEIVNRLTDQFQALGVNLRYERMSRNGGASAARNMGMLKAKGTCIAFLDADDMWHVDKLAIVDTYFRSSGAGLLFHSYTEDKSFDDTAGTRNYEMKPVSAFRMLVQNPAQTSCAVIRNQQTMCFDTSMSHCEDYDLWMRMAEAFSVVALVGPALTRLGRPQLTVGGLSGNRLKMRIGEMRVYLKFCQRNLLIRCWFFPVLIVLSMAKHLYSAVTRRS